MDSVPCRYNAAVGYLAIVVNHYGRFPDDVLSGDIQPRVLAHAYPITNADPGRPLPAHFARDVKRNVAADRSEWVRVAEPETIQLCKSPGQEIQWVLKRPTLVMMMMHVVNP